MMRGMDERLRDRLQRLQNKFEGCDDIREACLLITHYKGLQHTSATDEERIKLLIKGDLL